MNIAPYIAVCPNCSARLPIHEGQMRQAQGQVRCANCRTAFFAPDHLRKGYYRPQPDPSDLLFYPGEDQQKLDRTDKQPTHTDETTMQAAAQQPEPAALTAPVPAPSEVSRAVLEEPLRDHSSRVDTMHSAQQQRLDAPLKARAVRGSGRSSSTDKHTFTKKFSAMRRRYSKTTTGDQQPKRGISRVWWWLGSLLLTCSLLLTLLLAHFDSWSRHPLMRSVYIQLCPVFDCELPLNMEPVFMQIQAIGQKQLSPGVYSVQTLITNSAYYTQPMPVVRLDFIDLQNSVHASRTYVPRDYAPGQTSLEPSQNFSFNLTVELADQVPYRLIPKYTLVGYAGANQVAN